MHHHVNPHVQAREVWDDVCIEKVLLSGGGLASG